MKLLYIVRIGTYSEFEHFETKVTNSGAALLKAGGIFNRNPEAWQIEIFDIDSKRKIFNITA